MDPYYTDASVTLYHGDCLEVLRRLPDSSIDAVVTDPPYGLEFMGKAWDSFATSSKAQASRRQEGGIAQATGPSFLGGLNPKCLICDRWQRGSNPCRCEAPEWTQERLVRLHSFQEWCEAWSVECLRVLKPGGHMLAFGGTRTFHRLACAVEDAGFEVRDSIAWLYGSGFPKSLDVSKAIDKAAGAGREKVRHPSSATAYSSSAGNHRPWMDEAATLGYREVDGDAPATPAAASAAGWGTALKPAFEPIVVARKPLIGTVASNFTRHGTGALNIDACRVGSDSTTRVKRGGTNDFPHEDDAWTPSAVTVGSDAGRWPTNTVLDDSQAEVLDRQSGERPAGGKVTGRQTSTTGESGIYGTYGAVENSPYDDTGGASRFFYVAKPDQAERVRVDGVVHPTVKPLDLMRWLIRLVTPTSVITCSECDGTTESCQRSLVKCCPDCTHGKPGVVLEPFAGSGTTVEACILEGFRCIAIEREADYLPLIVQRINRRRDPVAAVKAADGLEGTLFEGMGA